MFEIIRQEWKPSRVKVTHMLPKYESYGEALKKLKTLNETNETTFEIREIKNGN